MNKEKTDTRENTPFVHVRIVIIYEPVPFDFALSVMLCNIIRDKNSKDLGCNVYAYAAY